MKFFTTLQKQQQHQGLLQKRNPIPHQTNAQRFLCGIEKKCSFPNEGICSKTMSSYILQILLISTKIIPSNIINTKSNLNYNKEAMQEEGTLLHDLPLSLQKNFNISHHQCQDLQYLLWNHKKSYHTITCMILRASAT